MNPDKDLAPTQGRPFDSSIPDGVFDSIQNGVVRTTYRDIAFLKSPFDVVLYLQLIGRIRPRTIIEIGTKEGGSALWFADVLDSHGIANPRIVSVDIASVPKIRDPRILFLSGDARRLNESLGDDLLGICSHPWIVIEDSSHLEEDARCVLEFFHPRLAAGDFIVVEDGVVAALTGDQYRRYQSGPNRAVAAFLEAHPQQYQIDETLCDFFGRNATYNPNGWLRKV